MNRTLLISLLAVAPAAIAQDNHVQEQTTPAREARAFGIGAADWRLSLLGEAAFGGDVGSSGTEATFYRSGAKLRMSAPMSSRWRLEASAEHEFTQYEFDDGSSIFEPAGSPQLFEQLHRSSFGATAVVSQTERWSWMVGGQALFAAEDGAVYDDAFTARGFGGAMYHVSDRFMVGLGVVVASRLEDDVFVFPVPIIEGNWALTEDTTLLASTREGLRLTHAATEDLDLSLSLTYRFSEYRLDDDGSVPGGVFEEIQVPLALEAHWRPRPRLTISGGIGAYLYQNYRVDDSEGDEVEDTNVDPMPFVRAGLVWRF